MVAPMNESDLLSPDYDSVVKKDAFISNLNTNNYFIYIFGVSQESLFIPALLIHSTFL